MKLLLAKLLLIKPLLATLLLAMLLLAKLLLTMMLLMELLLTELLPVGVLLLLLLLLRPLLLPLLLNSCTPVVCQSLLSHQAGGEFTYSGISTAALGLISAAFPARLVAENIIENLSVLHPV
jgi:hypothetical protein